MHIADESCSHLEHVDNIFNLFDEVKSDGVLLLILIQIYRVSQEECARLRESDPYVKLYRYNPKDLCPK